MLSGMPINAVKNRGRDNPAPTVESCFSKTGFCPKFVCKRDFEVQYFCHLCSHKPVGEASCLPLEIGCTYGRILRCLHRTIPLSCHPERRKKRSFLRSRSPKGDQQSWSDLRGHGTVFLFCGDTPSKGQCAAKQDPLVSDSRPAHCVLGFRLTRSALAQDDMFCRLYRANTPGQEDPAPT